MAGCARGCATAGRAIRTGASEVTPSSARPRRIRAVLSLLAASLPLLAVARVPMAYAASNLEYAVKATFLLKFPAFITWPESSPQSTFNVCVVGPNPFNGLLREAAAGQIVEHRPIAVRLLATASSASGCQVMFVAGPDTQSIAAALRAVRGTPVLTVTDGQSDPDARGIINFVLSDERVRFDVDLRAAAANGLSISSKLLGIALHVFGNA